MGSRMFALPHSPAVPPQRPTWFLLRSKVFSWLYCHIALKMAQIGMANRSALDGITLGCAISQGKDARCSCRNRARLLVVLGDCRLGSSTTQRFSAKFFSYANSDRLTDTGFCSKSQPHSDCDSKRSDAHQSQPYSECNPNSDRHSDTNAARLSQSEGLADANASACVPLAALDVKRIRTLAAAKTKPASFSLAGPG